MTLSDMTHFYEWNMAQLVNMTHNDTGVVLYTRNVALRLLP